MAREDMTADLARSLHATLPHEQIARARFPMAFKAVEVSPLLPIAGNLVESARKQGACVHTVGVDRVSGDFFYFVEGGSRAPVSVQGNLVEMLAPSLTASSTNAEIEALLEGLIDRMLTSLSGGVVTELGVALADALPRLSRDGTGLEGTDIEAFETQARALADRSASHADGCAGVGRCGRGRRPRGREGRLCAGLRRDGDGGRVCPRARGGRPSAAIARPLALVCDRRDPCGGSGERREGRTGSEAGRVAEASGGVRADARKPVEATKPAAKAVEVTKPLEPAKPVGVAKPVEAAKPAEVANRSRRQSPSKPRSPRRSQNRSRRQGRPPPSRSKRRRRLHRRRPQRWPKKKHRDCGQDRDRRRTEAHGRAPSRCARGRGTRRRCARADGVHPSRSNGACGGGIGRRVRAFRSARRPPFTRARVAGSSGQRARVRRVPRSTGAASKPPAGASVFAPAAGRCREVASSRASREGLAHREDAALRRLRRDALLESHERAQRSMSPMMLPSRS